MRWLRFILLIGYSIIQSCSCAWAQTWTQLSPIGTIPPGRDYFSTVYSQATDRMIVFGGQLDYQSVPTLGNDVWVLTNADASVGSPGWMQLNPGGALPIARSYHTAVFDSVNNRMIVFGGDPQVGYCYQDLNDVWVLTNADGTIGAPGWIQLSPSGTAPGIRAHHAAVYDSANNRMIVFGGNNECDPVQNDVWVLSNANGLGGTPAWTQLSPAGTPPAPRSSVVAGYDAANNLLIIFGGGTDSGFTNDVWVLSHANGLGGTPTWSPLAVSGSTPPRAAGTGSYDPASNMLLVFGGNTTAQTNDVWQLSNANGLGGTPTWTEINPSGVAPIGREGPGMIYNPAIKRMIVYGGENCSSGCAPLSDMWALDFSSPPQPAIYYFTPTNALVGATVTITGTNFDGASTVYFNGTAAAFTLDSNSQITTIVPVGATTGPISVLTTNGTAVSTNDFYVSTTLPGSGTHLQFNAEFGVFSTQTLPALPWSVTAADVYGNGQTNLIVMYGNTNLLTVLSNNSTGEFSTSESLPDTAGEYSVVATDVNGDGKVDLVFPSLAVLTNNGSGGFSTYYSGDGAGPYAAGVADINGDGRPDLIGLNYSSPGNGYAYTNSGGGNFNLASEPNDGSYPVTIATPDINGDGKPDLIVGSVNGLVVSTNAAGGHFALTSNIILNTNFVYLAFGWSFAVTDVNGDGLPDIIAPTLGTNSTLTVLTNAGGGMFAPQAIYSVGYRPDSVITADVNSDGKPDIICANYGDNTLTVLTNDGSGGFDLAATLPVGSAPTAVMAMDVNGDGGLDLVCVNSGDNTLTVLTNTPVGPLTITGFSPATNVLGTAVTIRGLKFTTATNVAFNGVTAAFTIDSDSQITAIVPAGATTGPISIDSTNATAVSTNDFTVIHLPVIPGTWTQLSPAGPTPPGRDNFPAVYSQTANRMIVFGGQLDYQSVPTLGNDVWVLTNADGTTGAPGWVQLTPGGTLPSARSYHPAVYDPTSNRMIVFGGDPSVGNCYVDLNDVWVLTNADGTAGAPGWIQLSPTGTLPGARAHLSAVYDSVNNRMIVFGGNNECDPMQNDVWVLSNANGLGGTPAWTQLSPTGGPPAPRASYVAGYDPTNNLLIVFGGNTAAGPTNDVWILSHANGLGGTPNWSQETVLGNAPPRYNDAGTYDPVSNTLLVFGGDAPGQTNDVWLLLNANGFGGMPAWVKINTSGTQPANREGVGLIYNPLTYRLIVYGGLNCSPSCSPLSDVWALNLSPHPVIYSFSPTNGDVGTIVTINGTNFTDATAVYFNGTNASFAVNSDSQITATVPGHATFGPISVVTPNGTAVSANDFVVGNLSLITGFNPVSGVVGAAVTISGTNFTTVDKVTFNGMTAAFSVNSDTQIVATVPSCAGSGPIVVTDSAGVTMTTSNFTLIRQPVTVNSPTEADLDDALCNGSTVTFAFDGTVNITSTKVISSDIVLDGTGHTVVISGGNNVGIFSVNPGVHLTLRNLTIANGHDTGVGAGIYNSGGVVTLDNCTFSNNVVVGPADGGNGAGGAVYNTGFFSGLLVANNSTFVGNRAIGGVGATGTNGATANAPGEGGYVGGLGLGGAICNDGGATVIITNCTFDNNQAVGGNGGAGGQGYDGYTYTYVCGSYSCGFFQTCYIYCDGYGYGGEGGNGGNGGNGYGGDIYNNYGSLTAVNTTFADGSANGGIGGSPGANGTYYLQSYYPSPGSSGAGVGGNLGYGSGTFALKNCIVANAAAGGNYWGGNITDAGNNLSSDGTLPLTAVTSLTNANPNLSSLTNNGGPTLTMALLPASPAIRAGTTNGAPSTDQRGLPRKAWKIDLGAYETQVLTSSIPSVLTARMVSISQSATNQFTLLFTNTPGSTFSVWSSTNLLMPFGDWIWLGFVREIAPGQFQFNDPNSTNNSQEFYRVTSP